MSRKPVVRHGEPLPKQQLHELLMAGWSRCIALHGQGAFADALGITGTGLRKQLAGGMPEPELIFASLTICPHALDDVLGEIDFRLVPKEAACTSDDAEVLLSRLLNMMLEAKHPDSPGGKEIVHTELLPMEGLMRELHKAMGSYLETIADLRRPRAVA